MVLEGMISIGILARRSGVQAETIRYYESEGLLPKPERTAGGYRLYGASDIERLSFIRQARELGFKVDSVPPAARPWLIARWTPAMRFENWPPRIWGK